MPLCIRMCYLEVSSKPGGIEIECDTPALGLCWWKFIGQKHAYYKEKHRSFISCWSGVICRSQCWENWVYVHALWAEYRISHSIMTGKFLWKCGKIQILYLRTTLTNQNCIHKKLREDWTQECMSTFSQESSSRLLSKKWRLKCTEL